MIGVKQAERFLGPLKQIMFVALERLHTADVHVAQIIRLFTCVHPCRQRLTRAASRLDADRIESSRDPNIVHLWCQTKVVSIIRCERFWPVKERVDARLCQHRHPVDGLFQDRFKMVKIFGELVKLKVLRDAIHRPRFSVGFKRTEQDFSCVFFVIRTFVGDAQDRHLGQPLNRLGHDIEMLAGMQRDVDARHTTNFVAPHTATVHDHVAVDCACLSSAAPIHGFHPTTIAIDLGHGSAFNHLGTVLTRPFCQSQRDVCRVALPIKRQVNASGHTVDVQMFVAFFNFFWADFLDFNTERARHRRLAENLFFAFLR